MAKHNVRNKKAGTRLRDGKISSRKNKELKRQTVVLILIGVIILVLMVFFAVRARNHYIELREHRAYFRQPNAPIQDWMTIHSVVRYYNLSESEIYATLNVSPGNFVSELGIDNSTVIDRMTIQTICIKKHLDCDIVVDKLNSIVNSIEVK